MAQRPVFVVSDVPPYYIKKDIEFEYVRGQNISQQRKCYQSLHAAFSESEPDRNILEISSKSLNKTGVSLSAFNLMMHINDYEVTVEQTYHASKVFEYGGPYTDILEMSPIQAKRDERLKNSGNIVGYSLLGVNYPVYPACSFYNWIYIKALVLGKNRELAEQILKYDAFTDISFNPKKSVSCQAQSAAIYVSLYRMNLTEVALGSYNDFLKTVYT